MNHKFNLRDSISLVAGSMIGSGIFIVSADIARQVQSGLLLILVWLIAAVVTMCGALSFGELATNIKDDGGQFIYLKNIFNDKLAFLYGWTTLLVIQTGTIAAVCTAFSKFIGLLVPYISTNHCLFHIMGIHISTLKVFTLLIVVGLTYLNTKGLKHGIITHNLFTVTKVLALVAVVVLGLLFGFHWHILVNNFTMPISFNHNVINVLATAAVGAMFASITWNHITFVSEEVEDAERNIPKALLIGSSLVLALYFLINMIYVGSLPINLIQNAPEDIVATQLMSFVFGDLGKNIIAVIIMISAFGCANGMILAGSRVYYTMAKNKSFFSKLAILDEKTNVPKNSLWLQCIWISILVLWGNYTQLLDYVIYTTLIFYWITILGVFINRKQMETENIKNKVNSFIPATFLVIVGYIIVCLTLFKPTYTLPGLFITLLGLPVYYIWEKRHKQR